MGAVSSMCCETDKTSKVHKESIPAPTKQRVNMRPLLEDKKEIVNDVKVSKPLPPPPPLEVPTKDTKNEKDAEDELIKILQSKYPLPNDRKSIKWENFQVTHRIGSGGFGEVFLGELTDNKTKGIEEKYAIKRIPKAEILKRKLTANIKLQKKILHESKCNFITTLHYAFRDAKYLYLVMEWAQGGDTYSLINQKSNRLEDFKKAGEKAVRFILACLILGMEYLHSKNIMYRDLKPQNVLIFQNGYAKLTDFGLAKEIKEEELSKTQAGTTIYYAPEMVLRQGYGKQIDLWTIGIFAYEMSNYNPPFSGPEIKDKQRVKRLVKAAQNHRTWKNPQISEELKDFINALLKFDPKERLGYKSWDDIKSHKFFTCVSFDWKALEEMKMQSPLKAIVDRHKSRYKNYVAENKAALEANSKSDEDWSGWTFKNNCQV